MIGYKKKRESKKKAVSVRKVPTYRDLLCALYEGREVSMAQIEGFYNEEQEMRRGEHTVFKSSIYNNIVWPLLYEERIVKVRHGLYYVYTKEEMEDNRLAKMVDDPQPLPPPEPERDEFEDYLKDKLSRAS